MSTKLYGLHAPETIFILAARLHVKQESAVTVFMNA